MPQNRGQRGKELGLDFVLQEGRLLHRLEEGTLTNMLLQFIDKKMRFREVRVVLLINDSAES